MKRHEAPPGKLQQLLQAACKTQTSVERGKTSFPSSLGQRNSSPLIAQSELELSRHVFILVTQPQMLPGLNIFQERCADVRCPSQG